MDACMRRETATTNRPATIDLLSDLTFPPQRHDTLFLSSSSALAKKP